MSKKKHKNSNYKKTNDKPVEEELSPALQKVQLVLKHHIILWLMLFPPIAFYRLFKYKIINKKVGIVLISFLVCFILLLTYSALNPTLGVDVTVEKYMKDSNYGTVREIEYLGTYEGYNVADVITTQGYYTIYFTYESELIIDAIIQLKTEIVDDEIESDFEAVYLSDSISPLIGKLNPAVIKFVIKNNDYGQIQEVVENGAGMQTIKTDKGIYAFYYTYYDTVNIQKLNEKTNEWVSVMNRDYVVKMKDEFVNALNKKKTIPLYYQVETVNSYGINANEIYYIFTNFCGNKYRIVKFNDGRISLEAALNNPVAQEDLAAAWEAYLEVHEDVE